MCILSLVIGGAAHAQSGEQVLSLDFQEAEQVEYWILDQEQQDYEQELVAQNDSGLHYL